MMTLGKTQTYLRLAWYYILLYFFTVVFNVANKTTMNLLPLPWTVATCQVFLGLPLFLPIWLVQPPRNLHKIDLVYHAKIGACHGFGNVATVFALGSGSVSFVHVVKAAEPLFSAALSVLVLNSQLPIAAYLALIPIVVGVAMASANELTFSWVGFGAAMLSNLLYQARMVFSKASISASSTKNSAVKETITTDTLSAVTTFRVVTLLAFVELLPLAMIFESHALYKLMSRLSGNPDVLHTIGQNLLISGLSFYIYNEVAFWILDLVHPVTHAVGNTIKRIVLILASILIFQTEVSGIGLLGSAIAVGGSFAYAVAQQQQQPPSNHRSHSPHSSSANLLRVKQEEDDDTTPLKHSQIEEGSGILHHS